MANEFVITSYWGFSVDSSGTVHQVLENAGGRVEWDEPLCESPVRDALPEWVWDLTMDPRNDG